MITLAYLVQYVGGHLKRDGCYLMDCYKYYTAANQRHQWEQKQKQTIDDSNQLSMADDK